MAGSSNRFARNGKDLSLMIDTKERVASTSYSKARQAMIDSQLRTSGVNEPWVLSAFNRVERERFVPADAQAAAYIDRAIALGDGTFLAPPIVHARILAEAAPTAQDKALLVGDGQGYLAELLRPLVGTLEAIDTAQAATKATSADYSLIVIDGAAEQVPDTLAARLADDGRLVTGLVERGISRLAVGRKTAGQLALLPLAEMGIPVLAAFAAPKKWSF
jgi:protein-L-isoaspartate(D-aspartate) O-methyltransferase